MEYNITAADWLVTSINYILLNFVFILTHGIFSKGFQTIIARSIETRNATILGLAKLAEYRDHETGTHLKRISRISVQLATELRKMPEYSSYITDEYIADLSLSSILHDIGKVGIEDSILLNNGPLTKEEFDVIKKHPEMGEDVILEIEKNISGRSLYALAREIALYHHERWDGSGYPKGLHEKDIPLSARIVALADVYDALISKRPYKDPIPHKEALALITGESGKHFDPKLVSVFFKIQDSKEKDN